MLLLTTAILAIASDRFTVGPAPEWVEAVPLDLGWTPPPGTGGSGVSWLLIDQQTRRSSSEITLYARRVERITSSDGLEAASQVSLVWDPSWEDLRIHTIRLHRDGQVLDRLAQNRIQVLRRETGLENSLYDGSLSAILVLDDLRVGDVLEVESSWTGTNPVFGDRFAATFGTGWSTPVHRFHTRFLWPEDRELHVRTLGGAPEPVVVSRSGVVERSWDLLDPTPIAREDLTPNGFRPAGIVQLSEDESWADVARWASELHRLPTGVPPRLGPALQHQVDAWAAAAPDDEGRIDLVLDFLQEEVRYVGIEIGEGTHRPAAPDVVFERRFGDCKDKATLLVAALRALGVEAWPALVNTSAGTAIDGWLPSRHAFDHVIAAVMLDGRMLFLDPTDGPQGARPSARRSPPWRRALLVRSDTVSFTEIPRPDLTEPETEVDEHWTLSTADSSGTVRIESRYRGADADRIRRDLRLTSSDELARRYVNYYAGMYPGIESAGLVESSDDLEQNVLTVVETYRVPRLWTPHPSGASEQLDLVAGTVREGLWTPTIRQRVFPLAVPFPLFVHHTMHVTMETGFTIESEELRVRRPELDFERTLAVSGKTLELGWQLHTLDDAVPPAGVSTHLDAVAQVLDAATFSLTRTPPGYIVPWRPSWIGLAAAFGSALVSIVGAAVVYRAASSPPATSAPRLAGPVGFGGWLLLPAFGVLVTPVRLVLGSQILSLAFDGSRLDLLEPSLRLLVVVEVCVNIVLFVSSVLLVVLMVQRRRWFPRMFIGYFAANALFLVVDGWAAGQMLAEVDRAVGTALLWGSYMAVSRRVRATFVR